MASKLLEFLEIAHAAGYVHNDIALDTIYLGFGQRIDLEQIKLKTSQCFTGSSLHFLDFSYMTPYIDFKTGKPLKQSKQNNIFKVSNDFQSLNRV